MGVVPNAPDGLVQVIAEKLKRRFGDVKVVFDCSHVAASLALSLIFMYNLGGFGVTTAISALFPGPCHQRRQQAVRPALYPRGIRKIAPPQEPANSAIRCYISLYFAISCYILSKGGSHANKPF